MMRVEPAARIARAMPIAEPMTKAISTGVTP
jgi:hypothetical protein